MVDSVNPSHTKRTRRAVARPATVEQANAAVAAAAKAFDGWRDTPVDERAGFLRRAADVHCAGGASSWRRGTSTSVGKPWREADADVAEAIDFCEYYARKCVQLAGPRHRDVPGEDNAYFYEPRGVAVVIAPWNFPLAILSRHDDGRPRHRQHRRHEAGRAVGRHRRQAHGSASSEAGLPPGVVNFLPGVGEEIGPALVDAPGRGTHRLHRLAEGRPWRSTSRRRRRPAGRTTSRSVIAEMGGKNAIIVDDDADLDEAVQGVVDSAFGYAGQKCSAGSRAIVLERHLRPVPRTGWSRRRRA